MYFTYDWFGKYNFKNLTLRQVNKNKQWEPFDHYYSNFVIQLFLEQNFNSLQKNQIVFSEQRKM